MHQVVPIHAFNDNYIWAIIHPHSNKCVIIDPGDATPVEKFLIKNKLAIRAILITHHHHDHMGGVEELIKKHPCPVYGPETLDLCSNPVVDLDQVNIEDVNLQFKVMATPGHTLDHLVYFNEHMLFCGDTLFSAGCGRLFEGTAIQLFTSLQKIAQLNDATKVYCGHEYTVNNLEFALHVEPNNLAVQERLAQCKTKKCTLPSTIGIEKATNPFLRCHVTNLQTWANINDELQAFKRLRQQKDQW